MQDSVLDTAPPSSLRASTFLGNFEQEDRKERKGIKNLLEVSGPYACFTHAAEMNYNVLLEAIGQAHQQAQAGAAGAVNRHLILRNWIIGAYLVEFEQNGKDRASMGQDC